MNNAKMKQTDGSKWKSQNHTASFISLMRSVNVSIIHLFISFYSISFGVFHNARASYTLVYCCSVRAFFERTATATTASETVSLLMENSVLPFFRFNLSFYHKHIKMLFWLCSQLEKKSYVETTLNDWWSKWMEIGHCKMHLNFNFVWKFYIQSSWTWWCWARE